MGETNDCGQPRLARGPLEKRDLSAVKVAPKAERLLGEAEPSPLLPEVSCEPLLRLHPEDGREWQTEALRTKPLGADNLARSFR